MLSSTSAFAFGAGLKAIELLLCGTPSVTTNIGAEAMFGNFQWNGFIDDNPQDLPIQRLNYIRISWLEHNLRELRLLIIGFQKIIFIRFQENIASAIVNLKQQRMNNFMGNAGTIH
jgi:hypothetical protein